MSIPVIIVQPPLVQLNGPYPSGAYLAAFFRGLGGEYAPIAADFSQPAAGVVATSHAASSAASASNSFAAACSSGDRLGRAGLLAGQAVDPARVRWIDACNGFYRHLFSPEGLTLLFSLSRDAALARADRAEGEGDGETAFQLRRFVSTAARWVSWIDGIRSILEGGDRERCHALVQSPYAPRGARIDAFLSGLEAEPTADDARLIATLALEDLADYIAAAFDPEFSLVRYAESIASSERSFARVEAALSGPLASSFIEPYAEALFADLASDILAQVPAVGSASAGEPFLLCLSVPFPGCLVGALILARAARRRFGKRAVIALGGGYVNTELRGTVSPRLGEYVDILSFDRGFAAYAALFAGAPSAPGMPDAPAPSGVAPASASGEAPLPVRLFAPAGYARYEARVTELLVPDYSDIDFASYPRLADTPNPMHRLWSDGAWLKAFLAHGCYWHRCSFCDVSLDYIAGYRQVAVKRLYAGLRAQARARGARGIHLVDEAAPPRALRDFARENLLAARGGEGGAPGDDPAATGRAGGGESGTKPDGMGLLSFWGNIRFERSFSRDLAEFLSAGGLVGVSGGIEIASAEGFKSVDKGIDLENLVACCAAFKESGVLVHSYLIYGYWDEGPQGIVDAMETMRQLFSAGLVDSAFWHKFVLTRHSRVYGEYLAGKHRSGRALEPVDERGDFADNDLRFSGEADSARYGAPLDAALQAWMAGDGLDSPVRSWFPFPMPAPTVAKGLVDGYVAAYERKRDNERNRPCDPSSRYWWVASLPVAVGSSGDSATLVWWHLGEEIRLELDRALLADFFKGIGFGDEADSCRSGDSASAFPIEADARALSLLPRAIFKRLRAHGLVKISLG
ncbi:MAG TPA: radical SAM protein [Treponemataceae bacterium]|nr:radical SAM protein [Treponemataceae bacterium]